MRNTLRNLRNFIPYLLTASLFTIAGVLLVGLLYYPLPSASTTHATESVATTDQAYWRSHAENMLAAMLADAVRQLQAERQTQTHNPRSPHGNSAPSGELPAGLRVAPLIIIENGGDPSRPVLIRL
ncbi:MAG: hypothetical protein IPL59_20285 [Candidatus Competibacteraceae bacterium]|uniref:Uncharacterized protein n=1 Tax=Candidatus Contendobacter odensis Run_B_J11 TaxID=1400861 RepID=A0A7U7GF16_9GAMM|nr:hypothetical protein [Candidatus Contendobacter odensis]MBK8537233.1 hypothetical protein [Candidatus Competibacteraceae bacterium]MBK8754303.1 hypothetical protein [Candidatus Competibacteraceae bacterium]CDH47193.1 exported hypothetical protein [Candidatus Contendobacter odensis Run_B_J11]